MVAATRESEKALITFWVLFQPGHEKGGKLVSLLIPLEFTKQLTHVSCHVNDGRFPQKRLDCIVRKAIKN